MKYLKFYLLSILIIVIDQAVKLTVHETMELGHVGEIAVLGEWFKLHYTLNNGMAFGIQFDWAYGKLSLTLFRWIAILGIGYYIISLVKSKKVHQGFVWCMALILGGAMGNVIDSTFYGIFIENNAIPLDDAPPFHPWFHGRVIDMFYFDIWQGVLPNWIPLMGGKYYSFWPIFNIADASIFVGVFTTIFFNKKFFPTEKVHSEADATNDTTNEILETHNSSITEEPDNNNSEQKQ